MMQWLLCRQRRERSSQSVGVCEVPSAHVDIRLEGSVEPAILAVVLL